MAPSPEVPFIFLLFQARHFVCSLGFILFHPFGVLESKILFSPPVLCFRALQVPSSYFYLQKCSLAKVLCLLCSTDFLATGTMVLMTPRWRLTLLHAGTFQSFLLLSLTRLQWHLLCGILLLFQNTSPHTWYFFPLLATSLLSFAAKLLIIEFLYGLCLLSHLPFVPQAFLYTLAKKQPSFGFWGTAFSWVFFLSGVFFSCPSFFSHSLKVGILCD